MRNRETSASSPSEPLNGRHPAHLSRAPSDGMACDCVYITQLVFWSVSDRETERPKFRTQRKRERERNRRTPSPLLQSTPELTFNPLQKMAAAAGVGRDQTQINQNGNDEFAGLLLDEKETEDFQQFVLQLLHQTKDQSIREIPFTSISHDNVDSSYSYADELVQFLLLHQENQEIPEALISSGPLRASNINKCVPIKK